jgi:hypothetical protein
VRHVAHYGNLNIQAVKIIENFALDSLNCASPDYTPDQQAVALRSRRRTLVS